MAQTFAQQMVEKIKAALLSNVGVGSITVDGQTISFSSREGLLAEYDRWQRQASGRSRMKTFDLS